MIAPSTSGHLDFRRATPGRTRRNVQRRTVGWLVVCRSGLACWVVLVVSLGASPGHADCACRCIDGQLRTACASSAEAAAEPDLCPRVPLTSCPQNPSGVSQQSYAPPDELAENCRNVALYDPQVGDYVVTRACDVP
jgi:hypothetical protein